MDQKQDSEPGGNNDYGGIDSAFVHQTLSDVSAWVRFGDAKAGAVLVLLGLLLADALSNARALHSAYKMEHAFGTVTTILFWCAMVAVAIAVVLVSLALFPRVTASTTSLAFFRDIEQLGSFDEYRRRLFHARSVDEQAKQVWELSVIAETKYRLLRWAYLAAVTFLITYVVARLLILPL